MRTNFVCRAVAIASSLLMMAGCGDVVIKVQKKPKNVDLSALENFSALNLQNSQDFLHHLDNLKVVAADLILKELASRDYRSEVRNAIRNYRSFLIQRAQGGIKVDDSFYASADECRTAGLNFNMEEANGFLGLILKTAVLAKVSEVSAPKLNPGISKELAAISQIILMELGLKIEGDVNVEEIDGVTKTTGTVSLSLSEIAGEAIDDATKARDAAEVLKMSFTRALGDNYIGSFEAKIEMGHLLEGGDIETLMAKIVVERSAVEDKLLHTIGFQLGVKDGPVSYSRKMAFEQIASEKHKVQITDTIAPGSDQEASFVTVIDVKAGTQCKLQAPGTGGDGSGKGNEGGYVDAGDPKAPVDPVDGTDGGDGSDGSDGTDGGTDGSDGSDGAVDGGKDGQDDGKGGKDGGKGKTDDDDDKGGSGKVPTPNNPGQSPGQHPGQYPGQHPGQHPGQYPGQH